MSACVGVGIIGKEGYQASRASDFSIGQFKFLKRLLFVHGRESYRKNSYIVIYNFYKNIAFLFPQFFLGFYSYFSGIPLYDAYIYQLYNLIFTSVPIIYYGIFDKDTEYDKLEFDASYYSNGINSLNFSSWLIWRIQLSGFIQGLIVFFLCFFGLNENTSGQIIDLNTIGSFIYLVFVIVVNIRLLFVSGEITIYSFILIILSIASYFGVLALMDLYVTFENYGTLNIMLNSGFLTLSLLIFSTGLCILLDVFVAKTYWYFKTKKMVSS